VQLSGAGGVDAGRGDVERVTRATHERDGDRRVERSDHEQRSGEQHHEPEQSAEPLVPLPLLDHCVHDATVPVSRNILTPEIN